MIEDITPIVITYNEEANIARTLDRLAWAQRIVVIDSGSTDGTLDIVRSYPRAEVVHRPFDDFASQCNFGIAQVSTTWVLSLDADYELSDELVTELHGLRPDAATGGYQAQFVYRVFGRPLRGTLYPPRTVLYRKDKACYQNEGHGHRVNVAGNVVPLAGVIFHDDRKPLARWFSAQQRYAREEAEHLMASDRKALGRADQDPAFRLACAACSFHVRARLEGMPAGWLAWLVLRPSAADVTETMLALELLDRRLRRAVRT